ncbi:MAG: phosphatidylglycerol lysyltransferase domain-containing protein [Deltaproteobacteria bacterium]|jgi:hypothetical protein|nr:phosphatidylglycerol lysyltransferase domain-containing protein [Deltaproteobacteria bacterium]
MSFKELSIGDQDVFREAEQACPLTTSDVNFTNMFIWNEYYHFTWTKAFDCLCLLAHPENSDPFALPPLGGGDKMKAAEFLFNELTVPKMSRVPQELADLMGKLRPDWKVESDPDNDDYVYLSEKLINLSGRRMHQKKNHYNSFVQNNRYELLEVTRDLIPELSTVEDLWLTAKTEKIGLQSHLIMEKKAVHLLLANLETLNLHGLAIRIGGKIEAFTIGEVLNPDTAVIHAEKGNPDIRGIYVALCSNFCRRYYGAMKYINREQDLGLPGLRFSKESLKPDHMSRKYVVTLEQF